MNHPPPDGVNPQLDGTPKGANRNTGRLDPTANAVDAHVPDPKPLNALFGLQEGNNPTGQGADGKDIRHPPLEIRCKINATERRANADRPTPKEEA